MKVLLNSLHLNGHTLEFHPQRGKVKLKLFSNIENIWDFRENINIDIVWAFPEKHGNTRRPHAQANSIPFALPFHARNVVHTIPLLLCHNKITTQVELHETLPANITITVLYYIGKPVHDEKEHSDWFPATFAELLFWNVTSCFLFSKNTFLNP